MKYWLIVISCFCVIQSRAQQFVERVYLKDSVTFYEGYIIEQAPAKYLRIHRLKEADTLQVELLNILKITKEFTGLPKKLKPPVPEKLRYNKSVFFELGGRALLYSLNFDMRTARGRRDGWGLSIGLSSLNGKATGNVSGDVVTVRYIMLPFSLNYLFGMQKSALELGLGATYSFINVKGRIGNIAEDYNHDIFDKSLGYIFGTFNIGYRHTPLRQGIMYRLMFNPVAFGGTSVVPWLGLSIGYKFK